MEDETLRYTMTLTIVVCITGLFFARCQGTPSHSAAIPAKIATNVELIIDYSNNTQQLFSNLAGSTAFEVLNESAELTYIQYTFGVFVTSINGVRNDANGNGHFWQFWVNGALAPLAANLYGLSDNDRVLWKYCPPEHPNPTLPLGEYDMWIGLVVIVGLAGAIIVGALLVNRKIR